MHPIGLQGMFAGFLHTILSTRAGTLLLAWEHLGFVFVLVIKESVMESSMNPNNLLNQAGNRPIPKDNLAFGFPVLLLSESMIFVSFFVLLKKIRQFFHYSI